MDTIIIRRIDEQLFTVILAEADPSQASLYVDKTRICKATWDGESLDGGIALLPKEEDSDDVYAVLELALMERADLVHAVDTAAAGPAREAAVAALVAFDETTEPARRTFVYDLKTSDGADRSVEVIATSRARADAKIRRDFGGTAIVMSCDMKGRPNGGGMVLAL